MNMENVERTDRAPLRLDNVENTPSGGKKIPARLARTGVLMYRDPDMPDGWRRELRLDEEQFATEALATLDGAAVVGPSDHSGFIDVDTHSKVARGHVADVQADGPFVAATLHVNDRATLDAIERGELREISLGYRCSLDDTQIEDGHFTGPGPHNGVRADFVQRGLKFNHAALLPPNGGRAGSEVGLRLDSDDDSDESRARQLVLAGRAQIERLHASAGIEPARSGMGGSIVRAPRRSFVAAPIADARLDGAEPDFEARAREVIDAQRAADERLRERLG